MGIIYVWTIVFDFHTIYKRKDLTALLNAQLFYLESFIQQYARRDIQQNKNWAPIILGILIVLLLIISTLYPFVYLLNCQLHSLAPLFPICSKNEIIIFGGYQTTHYSVIVVLCMSVVQFLFFFHNVSTTFIHITIGLSYAYLGLNIIRELRTINTQEFRATYSILRTHRIWAHNYRCCQILTKLTGLYLFDILLPFAMAITMILNILFLYILITVTIGLPFIICSIMFECVILLVYFEMIDRIGKFYEVSKIILHSRKRRCYTKYQKKTIKVNAST